MLVYSVLLILCVTSEASNVPEFIRTINFKKTLFIPSEKLDLQNKNFIYVLCADVTSGFDDRDVNCTLVIETPTAKNESKLKYCHLNYTHEGDRNAKGIKYFYAGVAKLHLLDDRRVLFQMRMREEGDSYASIYSFVNIDTCEYVNRYYNTYPRDNKLIYYRDMVGFIMYESNSCGDLRNCTIYVDFDGDEKKQTGVSLSRSNNMKALTPTTSDKGFFIMDKVHFSLDHDVWTFNELSYYDDEKGDNVLISEMTKPKLELRLISLSHKFFGVCGIIAVEFNGMNFNVPEEPNKHYCFQYDEGGNLKFNTTFDIGDDTKFFRIYNLRGGGLLLFTHDCEADDEECDGFDVTKMDEMGREDGYATVSGMPFRCRDSERQLKMDFTENENTFCIYTVCAREPIQQTTNRGDSAELRSKCIPKRSFKKTFFNDFAKNSTGVSHVALCLIFSLFMFTQ